ncbi:PH domain-containing protein [uncultured Lamprocystis sp.]|jgi:uncharacterized membrane protein YdbT with pleckstrin-like domain|uniref:PH domain-containing protein n=1 Tax=uncultured Lamprocystis sp. TaxID=543132 RepID=UPI0025F43F4C|nr:PH domain-containing protein [uncultured Lamprocystis sp.]
MSDEVRYEAHPASFRMRPFATLITVLVMVAGVILTGFGERLAPLIGAALGGALSGQIAQYLGVAMFAIGGLVLFAWYVPARFDRLTITDDSLSRVVGLFNKRYTEVSLDSVRTLQVNQSLLQRMLDVGDLTIYTTGDLPELTMRGLPNPERIRSLVQGRA